jgi:hypothetical protein
MRVGIVGLRMLGSITVDGCGSIEEGVLGKGWESGIEECWGYDGEACDTDGEACDIDGEARGTDLTIDAGGLATDNCLTLLGLLVDCNCDLGTEDGSRGRLD